MPGRWFCIGCLDYIKTEKDKQWHTDVGHTVVQSDKVKITDETSKKKIKEVKNKPVIRKVKGKIGNFFVESILVDGMPHFLCFDLDKKELSATKEIETENGIFRPIEASAMGYIPYDFTSEELEKAFKKRVHKEKILDKIKRQIDKFLVIDDLGKHLILGDVFLSYMQDKIRTAHFLFFVGETESGKSSATYLFRYLGYRCLYGDDIPNANIYNFLGTDEEGAGMIAEDEAQDIGRNRDKMKTYKNSYAKGSYKPRIITTSYAKIQVFYKTFCLKVFAGERIPDDKGFRERLVVVYMLEGTPESNIKMLTESEERELLQLRKALLLYKLQNTDTDLPKPVTNLRQRDRELWEGFLQGVHDTKYFDKCMETAVFYTNQRHETIWNSLEARIFQLVKQMLGKNSEFRLEEFWIYLINEQDILSGNLDKQTFFTNDFGAKITRNYLSKLFEQKFHAKRKSTYKTTDNKKHLITLYKFDPKVIETLTRKYNVSDDDCSYFERNETSGKRGGSGQLALD